LNVSRARAMLPRQRENRRGRTVRNFWAIVAGIVGLMTGFFAAAILSYVIMDWADVSNFEGKRGYAMVFLFGPMGGLVGLGLGVWLALRLTRRAH
jgi:hypothetical protein